MNRLSARLAAMLRATAVATKPVPQLVFWLNITVVQKVYYSRFWQWNPRHNIPGIFGWDRTLSATGGSQVAILPRALLEAWRMLSNK